MVAETLEQAQHAAALVRVRYDEAAVVTRFDPWQGRPPSEATAQSGRPGESSRGDADGALAAAPVKIDVTYIQPREHHNAMEPHATIACWQGDRLTLYDKTQWVDNDRDEIAHVFAIPAENIRVVSPYVGGAFGSALRTWPHVTIAALATRQVGRPVRLALTRRELYSAIGFRPSYAFGAVFVEVRVDPAFGTVRVPRIVGAYDIGRVVNPKIARSQCLGGMVGGLGMALLEEKEGGVTGE